MSYDGVGHQLKRFLTEAFIFWISKIIILGFGNPQGEKKGTNKLRHESAVYKKTLQLLNDTSGFMHRV